MDSLFLANLVIALIILSACLSILRCMSNDIMHTHAVSELTNEVNLKREKYLAELRGDKECGEVIILDSDNL
jgi:hypothetical protein